MKIEKWGPDNFELEMTTVWSFPERGPWATHDAKYRGNWSPYIPRNLLLRYSAVGDVVLDQFAGGGTTLVEAKLLGRNIVGVDVNPSALARCRDKINFEYENAGQVTIHQGDARKKGHVVPMSFEVMKAFENVGLKTKEITIKQQHNCRATGYWKNNSIKYNFLLLAHEYLFVFRKQS